MQDLGASSVSIQPVIGCSRESEQESDWVGGGVGLEGDHLLVS